jgi:hypothetical protein
VTITAPNFPSAGHKLSDSGARRVDQGFLPSAGIGT